MPTKKTQILEYFLASPPDGEVGYYKKVAEIFGTTEGYVRNIHQTSPGAMTVVPNLSPEDAVELDKLKEKLTGRRRSDDKKYKILL